MTDENEPNVEVNVEVNEPESAEEEAPTVVVVEAPSDDAGTHTDEEVNRWVQLEARLSGIENRIGEIAQTAYRAEAVAEEAQAEAEAAEEIAEIDADALLAVNETAVEAQETAEEVADEIAPSSTQVHPMFRPFRAWFPKRES